MAFDRLNLRPLSALLAGLILTAGTGERAALAEPEDAAAQAGSGFAVIFDQNDDTFQKGGLFPRLCGDIPKANTYCAEASRLGRDALGLFRANLSRPASPLAQDDSADAFDAPYVDTRFGQRVDRYRFRQGTEANGSIGLPWAPPTLISVYAAPDGKRNVVSFFLNDNDGVDYGGSARTLTGNMNFQNAALARPFADPGNALRLRVDVFPKWVFRFPDPVNDLGSIRRDPGDFPSAQINTAIQFHDAAHKRTFVYNLINYDQNRITAETVMVDTYQGVPLVQVALSPQPDGGVASRFAEALPDNGGPSLTHPIQGYQRFSIQLTHALFGGLLKQVNAIIAAKRLGAPISEKPEDYQVVLAGTGGEIGHPLAGRGVCGEPAYTHGQRECVTKLGFSVKNFQLSYGKIAGAVSPSAR